jgi:hypothetical protein
MGLSKAKRRQVIKNELIKNIKEINIATLTESFYSTNDPQERFAVATVAEEMGYNELRMQFLTNIYLVV